MKNTCIWMTSDESPAGMPSFMPRNSRPNWHDADREAVGDDDSRHGICGRRMKNTSGTAAKKKRSAASANGGISRRPTLIGTNENPQTA